MMGKFFLFPVLFLGYMALSLTGCVGYQLGSSLPPGISVVHVAGFVNETDEPSLDVLARNATIAEFQRDGLLMVGDMTRADVVLEVRLVGFSLEPLRYARDSATSTEEYRMSIKAAMVLKEAKTDKILAQTTVNGEEDFVFSGDLSSAKRTYLPATTADLAARLVRAAVEFW